MQIANGLNRNVRLPLFLNKYLQKIWNLNLQVTSRKETKINSDITNFIQRIKSLPEQ